KPGAGLFPLLIGVLLGALSLPALIHALRTPAAETGAREPDHHRRLDLVVFLALAAYIVVLPYAGFAISSTVLVAFLFYTAGRMSLIASAAFAVALVLPLYLVFSLLLKVQFPTSSFFS